MKEEAYRKGRELLSFGVYTCFCLHSKSAHKKKCTGLTGDQNFDRDCPCGKYRPKDNLEFLEWKYEEKLKRERRNQNK